MAEKSSQPNREDKQKIKKPTQMRQFFYPICQSKGIRQ